MITQPMVMATAAPQRATCDPATRITKSLLAYGVIAGPVYVLVSLAQALTRRGFDLAHDEWSLLANGGLGWIQTVNLIAAGLMTVALAVGLRRAIRQGRAGGWASRLVAVYGAGLVSAGVFRADPAYGFPPGTAAGAAKVSWHGMLHLASAGIGFGCLIVTCLIMARRFALQGRRQWAGFSVLTGVVFLAGFAGAAVGAGSAAANLAFTAAVVVAWAWVSAIAGHLYRSAAHPDEGRA